MVVASRNRRWPGRRAKRSGMELRIAQPGFGDTVQCRRRNDAAKRPAHAVALVIGHDEKNIGGALRRYDARRPPGFRILGRLLDHAADFRRRWRELITG